MNAWEGTGSEGNREYYSEVPKLRNTESRGAHFADGIVADRFLRDAQEGRQKGGFGVGARQEKTRG